MKVTLSDIPVFAQQLLRKLQAGDVVGLEGELGAGKTTLVQAVAAAMGVSETVTSPTFTMMNIYQTEHAISRLVHIDLYRLQTSHLALTGILEEMRANDTLTFIEWPENMGKNFPNDAIRIRMEVTGLEERRVTMRPPLLTNGVAARTITS